jgi:hypothetical protein
MLGRRSNLLVYAVATQDLVLTAFAMGIAYWIRTDVLIHFIGPSVIRLKIHSLYEHWPFIVMFLVVSWAGGRFLHIYQDVQLRSNQKVIFDILKLVIFGLVAVNALLYLFRADYVSRGFVVTSLVSDPNVEHGSQLIPQRAVSSFLERRSQLIRSRRFAGFRPYNVPLAGYV